MRWPRVLVVSGFLGLLFLVDLHAPLAIAQSATPVAPPNPLLGASLVDEAALTLRPSDLAALGLPHFGLANPSSFRDPQTDAQLEAAGDPAQVAARLRLAQETGLISRYVSSLLQPRLPLVRLPSGLIAAQERITSAVAEYATAEGAAQAFAVLTDPRADTGDVNLSTGRVFGDESTLVRGRGRDLASGDRFKSLELAFRHGNLVAQIRMVDYAGQAPGVTTIEVLAVRMLERMEQRAAHPAPDLGPRIMRLAPLAPLVEAGHVHDFYTSIDGQDEIEFGEMVAAIRAGHSLVPASATPYLEEGGPRPIAIYLFSTPVGVSGSAHDPFYVGRLAAYAEPEHATAALQAVHPALGPGYISVHEVSALLPPPGTAMRVFAYSYAQPDHPIVHGYLVVSQIDALLSQVHVDSPLGVAQAGVEAFAQRQIACLRVEELCPSMPLEEARQGLLVQPADEP